MLPSDADFLSTQIYSLMYQPPTGTGGRSRAVLDRTQLMGDVQGRLPGILTFAPTPYMDHERGVIADRGLLSDTSVIRNMWDELQDPAMVEQIATEAERERVRDIPPPLTDEPGVTTVRDKFNGRLHSREQFQGDKALRLELYRPDGSRYALVLRGSDVLEGYPYSEPYIFFGADDTPIAVWPHRRALWFDWTNSIIGDTPTCLIFDDHLVSRAFSHYRRDSVITIHLVHSSHVAPPNGPFVGDIRGYRKYNFDHMSGYDTFALLTNSQRRDVELRFGERTNIAVIPNSVPAVPEPITDSDRGDTLVYLANFIPLKQIDHIIKAVALASESLGRPLNLDLWGQGELQKDLEKLAKELGVADQIKFRGWRADAYLEYGTSSMTALTSQFEGQSRVLIEAMAHGCIPVAYDVRYGPGSLITHGVNGYLVRPDDINGLARAIGEFMDMPKKDQQRMREAAWRHSVDYFDSNVIARWSREIEVAWARKPVRCEIKKTSITAASEKAVKKGFHAEIDLKLTGTWPTDLKRHLSVCVLFTFPFEVAPVRFNCTVVSASEEGRVKVTCDFVPGALEKEHGERFVEIVAENSVKRVPWASPLGKN